MKKTILTLALAALSQLAVAGNLQVLVLDKQDKPVANAVVVVVPGNRGDIKSTLPTQVTIGQEKMRFTPAVSIVAVGAKAKFVNNDTWEHHVRGTPAGLAAFTATAAEGFEFRLGGKEEGKPAKSFDAVFEKAGPMLLGCYIHGSMTGHVYVSDSPWAVLTDADGVANIENITDGAAQIKVWHAEQLIDIAPRPYTVTAAPGKTTIQLSVVTRRRRI
jgi:plastocyanin